MKYKLIALDLDGTLTNERKEITPRTKEALMKAQKQYGVRVVLASGRPTYGISALAEELEIAKYDGYVMAYNGARIRRWSDHEILFDQTLEPEFVPELYKAAIEGGFQILTYQGEGIAATSIRNKYVMQEAFINKMPLVQYDDFLHQLHFPINKCLIVGDPKPLSLLEKQLAEQMKGRMNVYRSAGFFLECVPLGIDKAASLQRLIDQLGIKREEVIACGDGYNDLSMVQFAGLGVAMANATRELQDVADYITYSNEEDGVGHVVDKFIFGQ